jgi:antitoxin (DNA-binding transcriptional repressor) of toxin-antitoxin stability system
VETKITATELAKNLSDILNRARYKGEHFIIQRNGEAVAELKPVVPKPVPLRQIAAQLARIPRPDDRFADDLEGYLQEVRQPTPEPPEWPD